MERTTKLADGRILYAHFANNAGRGGDNCTLTLCTPDTERPDYTRNFPAAAVIAQTTTSAWKGKVNASAAVLARLGLTKTDLEV